MAAVGNKTQNNIVLLACSHKLMATGTVFLVDVANYASSKEQHPRFIKFWFRQTKEMQL
jgi:hypothetical protein